MGEAKLRYNEPLLREVVRVVVFRMFVRRMGVTLLVVFGFLVAMLGWLTVRRDTGWMAGLAAPLLLCALPFMANAYIAHRQIMATRYPTKLTPVVTLRYDEEQVHIASELGSASAPWSLITEVWRHSRFWLLIFSSPLHFVVLPLDCLDEQAREFITRKTHRSNV
mgnify:CR=1 FL=1